MTLCRISKRPRLIEGVVFIGLPVRTPQHGTPHSFLMTWLGTYWFATPETILSDNGSMRLDDQNKLQPDVMLMTRLDDKGQPQIDTQGYVVAGPELVAEIAAEGEDAKLKAEIALYLKHGVKEVLVRRVSDGEFDWWQRRGRKFVLGKPDKQGCIHSQAFPGLALDVAALLRFDGRSVLSALQRHLAGDAHTAFLANLREQT